MIPTRVYACEGQEHYWHGWLRLTARGASSPELKPGVFAPLFDKELNLGTNGPSTHSLSRTAARVPVHPYSSAAIPRYNTLRGSV
jgi:hypothetical protein